MWRGAILQSDTEVSHIILRYIVKSNGGGELVQFDRAANFQTGSMLHRQSSRKKPRPSPSSYTKHNLHQASRRHRPSRMSIGIGTFAKKHFMESEDEREEGSWVACRSCYYHGWLAWRGAYLVSSLRKVIRSLRSLGFLRPPKAILVPGMYFLGFSRYSNCSVVSCLLDPFAAVAVPECRLPR